MTVTATVANRRVIPTSQIVKLSVLPMPFGLEPGHRKVDL